MCVSVCTAVKPNNGTCKVKILLFSKQREFNLNRFLTIVREIIRHSSSNFNFIYYNDERHGKWLLDHGIMLSYRHRFFIILGSLFVLILNWNQSYESTKYNYRRYLYYRKPCFYHRLDIITQCIQVKLVIVSRTNEVLIYFGCIAYRIAINLTDASWGDKIVWVNDIFWNELLLIWKWRKLKPQRGWRRIIEQMIIYT